MRLPDWLLPKGKKACDAKKEEKHYEVVPAFRDLFTKYSEIGVVSQSPISYTKLLEAIEKDENLRSLARQSERRVLLAHLPVGPDSFSSLPRNLLLDGDGDLVLYYFFDEGSSDDKHIKPTVRKLRQLGIRTPQELSNLVANYIIYAPHDEPYERTTRAEIF